MQDSRDRLLTGIALILLSLLALLAPSFPEWHLWGIDTLRVWPPALRFLLVAALIVTLIPAVATRVVTPAFEKLQSLPKQTQAAYTALAMGLILVCFVTLTTNNLLSGDGFNILGNISSGKVFSPTEPLDYLCHSLVCKLLGGGEAGALWSYRVWSYLAGLTFLFGLYLVEKKGLNWIFYFALFSSFGVLQFFFGYVESYTLSFVLMFFYLLSARSDLNSSTLTPRTIILLLLAIGFHLASGVLLPSLFYLIYRKYHSRTSMIILIVLGIFTCVAGAIYLGYENLGREIFVPLFPSAENPYSLFSTGHLTDLINLTLRNYPLLLAIVLTSFFWRSRYLVVQLFVLVPALLFTAAVDPKIGAIRDWDLLSIASAPIMACMFLALVDGRRESSEFRMRLLVPLLLFGILHTGSFVWGNRDKEGSYLYAKEVLKADLHYSTFYYKGGRLDSWAELAFNYYDDPAEGFRVQQMRLEADPEDKLNRYNLANNLAIRGEYVQASKLLSNNWKSYLSDGKISNWIGSLFLKAQNYGEAEALYDTLVNSGAGDFDTMYKLGFLKAFRGVNDTAWYYLDTAMRLYPNAPLGNRLDYYLFALKVRHYETGEAGLKMIADSLPPSARTIAGKLIDASSKKDTVAINTLIAEMKRAMEPQAQR